MWSCPWALQISMVTLDYPFQETQGLIGLERELAGIGQQAETQRRKKISDPREFWERLRLPSVQTQPAEPKIYTGLFTLKYKMFTTSLEHEKQDHYPWKEWQLSPYVVLQSPEHSASVLQPGLTLAAPGWRGRKRLIEPSSRGSH